MAKLYVGCCGFPVARERYYRTFKAVEIQQTFYEPPKEETARKWRDQAPDAFLFTLKAWQLITHEPSSPTYRRLKTRIALEREKRYGFFKPTDEVLSAWETTRRFACQLRAKVVLFQCPARFTPEPSHIQNMRRFFRSLGREGLALAWEPRGKWDGKTVGELCRELDLIHCVDPLRGAPTFGRLKYFRLHGPAGYRSRYTSRDLAKVVAMCRGEAYCFFNNISMFDDGIRFLRLAQRAEKTNGEKL